ncbi:MAG: histidine phosphatase family protein [Deltaproteobacteria bacterium]|nr:histidine phosphatase family protein [Deltaproteobacteria bacterium]MBW2085287.1 histidine phosphatase family protein [Deltaproteobacteria bacterium]
MADLTLYLLRHGESEANVRQVFAARKIDPPLSDNGIHQASRQAESLKTVEFSAMYASPLLRTRQTAEIVSRSCGLEPVFSSDLLEIDVGVLDGEPEHEPRTWAVYERVIQDWEQGLASRGFPGGETLNDVAKRLGAFLTGLEAGRQTPVLIVGHCLLFMAAIWLFCKNHGPGLEDGHMGRGHLTIIGKRDDGFHILAFNISPDLKT